MLPMNSANELLISYTHSKVHTILYSIKKIQQNINKIYAAFPFEEQEKTQNLASLITQRNRFGNTKHTHIQTGNTQVG